MKKIIILVLFTGIVYADSGEGSSVYSLKVGQGLSISSYSITSSAGTELIRATTGQIILPKKLKVKELEVESNGLNSHGRGKFKNADVEIEDANRGLILTSSSSHKGIIWIDDNMNLFVTKIAASPEVSFEKRKARIKAKMATRANLINEYKNTGSGNVVKRLDIIEQILGLKEQ